MRSKHQNHPELVDILQEMAAFYVSVESASSMVSGHLSQPAQYCHITAKCVTTHINKQPAVTSSPGPKVDETYRKQGQESDACAELGCAVAEQSGQLRLVQAVPAEPVVVHVQVHEAERGGAERGDDGEAEHPVKPASFLDVHAAAALHIPAIAIYHQDSHLRHPPGFQWLLQTHHDSLQDTCVSPEPYGQRGSIRESGRAHLIEAAHADVDLQQADGEGEEDGVAQAHAPAVSHAHHTRQLAAAFTASASAPVS